MRPHLSILVLLVLGSPAAASPVVFNDRGEFDAALGGNYQLFTEFDFTTNVPMMFMSGQYGGLWIGDDVKHIWFGDTLTVRSLPHFLTSPCCVSLTGVTAVGFDVVASSHAGVETPMLLGYTTTGGLSGVVSAPSGSFLGLASNDTLSSLWFGTERTADFGSSLVRIDNLAVQTVPEPTTLFMVGTAALLTVLRRRR